VEEEEEEEEEDREYPLDLLMRAAAAFQLAKARASTL
jgi:hypothetical protein